MLNESFQFRHICRNVHNNMYCTLSRDEFDRQAQASREAMENLYNAKEADLKNQIKRLKDTITSKGDELSAVQSKLESM